MPIGLPRSRSFGISSWIGYSSHRQSMEAADIAELAGTGSQAPNTCVCPACDRNAAESLPKKDKSTAKQIPRTVTTQATNINHAHRAQHHPPRHTEAPSGNPRPNRPHPHRKTVLRPKVLQPQNSPSRPHQSCTWTTTAPECGLSIAAQHRNTLSNSSSSSCRTRTVLDTEPIANRLLNRRSAPMSVHVLLGPN